uniref:Pentatricopeptide repeat-containing protein n=1 Tax=Kalanchoe fedtschenkoi TaxID=63787 RepID=A0A7N0TMV1_KALFE
MNRIASSTSPLTKSSNAIINRLSSEGAHHAVLQRFSSMLTYSIPPDAYTFPSLLKACAFLGLPSLGSLFHDRAVVSGCSSDAYVASSLINFYARFGNVSCARKVFDNMPDRNVVPWTAIIGCYSKWGDVDSAFLMFNRMRVERVEPSSVTLLGVLYGVSDVLRVRCLHGCAVLLGLEPDVSLANCLINVYSKCGSIDDATELFNYTGERDIVSWNSIISGYAQTGNISGSLQLLKRMRSEGFEPDQQTLGSLVSVAALLGKLNLGQSVHSLVMKGGCQVDSYLDTAVVSMYLKCKNVDDAFLVFQDISEKDVVSWTAMISGLVQIDFTDKALSVFMSMLETDVKPSTETMASALAACAKSGSLLQGRSIHGYILRARIPLDIPAENSLITLYAKCGFLVQSCAVFETMARRDLVSWNAIIDGFAQIGELYHALLLFDEMRTSAHRPDSVTVVSLLQGCSFLGALQQGKWIHSFVVRNCLGPCLLIDTALVDMYCKCGDLHIAKKCFDQSLQHDVILWSSLIGGYGSHGEGSIALEMYSSFLQSGIEPNHVMFLAVLSACVHNGFVEDGLAIFHSMTEEYGIQAKLEHRACIVDLLSRAGRVSEAYEFYKRMFVDDNADVLGIILDACRGCGYDKLGDEITSQLLTLNPTGTGSYMQLAHSYASAERWDGVGEAWTQMRTLGLKKVPGWSYVELQGIIETFFTCHASHPQFDEMAQTLGSLYCVMRKLASSDGVVLLQ